MAIYFRVETTRTQPVAVSQLKAMVTKLELFQPAPGAPRSDMILQNRTQPTQGARQLK